MLERRPAGLSFVANVLRFPELDSTQQLARRILETLSADDVAPLPTLILAASQTSGRGRAGRSWISPGGGLYATFLVPAPPLAEALHRPLEIAVVLAEALTAAFGIPLRLKWPNDVLGGNGGKLAGILLEHVPAGEAGYLLIGLGVNVEATDVPGAVSISSILGRPVGVEEALSAVVAPLDASLAAPAPREQVLRRWQALSMHVNGDAIRVRRGDDAVEGIFRGLDEVGRLRLETAGGIERIASADVEV